MFIPYMYQHKDNMHRLFLNQRGKTMSKPHRIQRKRTKGWKMPPNTKYVGRGSRWGNPFVVGKDGTATECIGKYYSYLLPYTHRPPNNSLEKFYISDATLVELQIELRGKNLACWCKLSEPCHADWLLNLANGETDE